MCVNNFFDVAAAILVVVVLIFLTASTIFLVKQIIDYWDW